jgi:hypothetical protein
LSYINRNHARQTGTNRTTQAEISNAFWLGFPGRVKTEKLQLSLAEKSGAGHLHIAEHQRSCPLETER